MTTICSSRVCVRGTRFFLCSDEKVHIFKAHWTDLAALLDLEGNEKKERIWFRKRASILNDTQVMRNISLCSSFTCLRYKARCFPKRAATAGSVGIAQCVSLWSLYHILYNACRLSSASEALVDFIWFSAVVLFYFVFKTQVKSKSDCISINSKLMSF